MIRSILCSVGVTSCISVADVFQVPGDFATIAQAMNAAEVATGSHTILVGPGSYNETIIFNDPNITVESVNGPDVTIIDAADIYYRCADVKQTASGCKLKGFTLQNGYTIDNGGGVRITGPGFVIEDCLIQDCRAEAYGGAVYATQGVVISGSTIKSNSAQSDGGGVYLSNASPSTQVSECQFINNDSSNNFGSGDDLKAERSLFNISGSSFTNQLGGTSVSSTAETEPFGTDVIEDCTFTGAANGRALWVNDYSTSGQRALAIESCNIDSWSSGIYVYDSRGVNVKVRNTSISNCNTGLYSSQGDPASVEIDGCYFSSNTGSEGSALDINDSDAVILYDSTFCENTVPAILGNYESFGGNVFLPSCDTLTGVCCIAGACTDLTEQQCFFAGGQFSGYNNSCQEFVCTVPVIVGACCVNGNAITLEESDCSLVSGQFFGEGSNPDDVSCESGSSCPEDLDGNGEVGFPDLLEIISAWGPCSG